MISIEFCHNDKTVDFVRINCTELTAPAIIFDKHEGKFFVKVPVDSRIVVAGTPAYPLQYRECRGEILSNILVLSSPEEVA